MIVLARALRASIPVLALAVTACGTSNIRSPGQHGHDDQGEPKHEGDANASKDPASGDAAPIDQLITPPKQYYEELFTSAVNNASSNLALTDGTQVLFLAFDGSTVAKGFKLGQSFIPCKDSVTIPASGLSPADQSQILAKVKELFGAAGAKIDVTSVKPLTGAFTTMAVGGSYADLGCDGGAGILGIAPFDKGNANLNDIGFAFVPSGASANLIAETVAHEAGHSFGLDHVVEETDVMFASAGANVAGFGVSQIVGTGKTQDGPAVLQQVLGAVGKVAANVPPPASIGGLPNIPAGLAGLPGLTQLGSIGKLLPDFAASGKSPLDITQILPIIQTLVPLAGGVSGLGGLDAALTVIGLAGQASNGSLTTVPDLTQVLNLGNGIKDLPALLASFTGSTQIVNANYSGANQAALLSVLKVAYSQQFAQLAGSLTP